MSVATSKRLIFRRRAEGAVGALFRVAAFVAVLGFVIAISRFPARESPLLSSLLILAALAAVPIIWMLGQPAVVIDLDAEEVQEHPRLLFWRPRRRWPLSRFETLTLSRLAKRTRYAISLVGLGDASIELPPRSEAEAWRDAVRLSSALRLPVIDHTGEQLRTVSAAELAGPLARRLWGRSGGLRDLLAPSTMTPSAAAVDQLPGGGLRFLLRPDPARTPSRLGLAALGIVTAALVLCITRAAYDLPTPYWAGLLASFLMAPVAFLWKSVLRRTRPMKITVDSHRVAVSWRPIRTLLFPESVPTAEVTSVIARAAGGLAIVSPAKTIVLDRSVLSDALGLSEEDVIWLRDALTGAIAALGQQAVEAGRDDRS